MSHKFFFAASFVFTLLLWCVPVDAADVGPPEYTLTLSETNRRLVKVEARLPVQGGTLMMHPAGANHLPDGWAAFVRNLTAKNESGQIIQLQAAGKARWQIPEPLPQTITLSYDLLIEHDQDRWPFGHDEAAYVKADCVFFIGRALFIGAPTFKNISLRFQLPPGWRVSAPWPGTSRQSHTFVIPQADELLDAAFLVGKHYERLIKVEGVEAVIATGQDLKDAADLFEATIKPILTAASKLFGGAPVINGSPSSRFLIIANRDTFDGGGTFPRSISMLFKDPPQLSNRDKWGHIIVHELLHLWNGMSVRSVSQEHWLSEGFTDYLAYLLEARAGFIKLPELFAHLAREYGKYTAVAGKFGMRPAGVAKAKNYDLIYSGGLIAALALDLELLQRTGGRQGLGTLLSHMHREFGLTGKRYALADVVRLASGIGGTDLNPFFKDYVEGAQVIPLDKWLASVGLELDATAERMTLRQTNQPTEAARKLLAAWLEGQSQTAQPQAPPPLPGAEGVQPYSNRIAWVYTSNAALAPQMLQAIEAAAQSFTRHFGSAPPLVAVFDGASLSAEQRNAITAGGAVWVLPLPVSQMAGQAGGAEKAFGTLAHEIGHGWFVNALWAGTPGRTGLHYGGGAPDWLDEVAALLLENEVLTVNRRETLKRSLANSDTAKLIKPLGELFTMKHPGLDPAQMQEIVKRMQEARARGEATSAINLKPDPQSQQAMKMFYAQCRGWLDFLLQKSPDPKVLRSITDTLKSGKSMDDWLAAAGKRYGLPETLPKLQADWEAWLKQL